MAKVSRTKYLSNDDQDYEATDFNDRVFGGNGADSIFGYAGNDYLYGGNGNDVLNGGEDNDFLHGGNGDDFLYGETGNNILIGGYGADKFVLDLNQQDPTTNTISDFVSGSDQLQVRNSFTIVGFGLSIYVPLDSSHFVLGTTSPNNGSGQEHYIYDRSAGKLYYDADGSGGDPQVLLATLLGQPDLKFSDIYVLGTPP